MVVAVATSPSSPPGPGAAAARPHPTYKEMILQALTELHQPSRRAIANYISDSFSGLPSRHDALLSVHLRRLRSQGLLLMSGHSYLLSNSASAPHQQHRGRGRPPKNAAPAPQKRGPGRPRKNTLPVASSAVPVPVPRGPGRPRKNAATTSHPVVKRGVGRPRKNATPMPPPAPRPPPGSKRGPGRPRKIATPAVSVPPTALSGLKRGRGRPPKNTSTALGAKGNPGRPRKVPVSVAAVPSGKPQPGRPRKVVVAVAAKRKPGRPTKVVPSVAGKRKPGRPPKIATSGAAVQGSSGNVVVNTTVAGVRRGRGRPPKAKLPAHGGIASSAAPSLIAGKRTHDQIYNRKDEPLQSGSVLSGNAALTKRGPGRPRKKRLLEAGGGVAAEVEAGPTEDGGEAEHIQIVGEAEAGQNGGEVRSVLSGGASSMEKSPGSVRMEVPLENEHTQVGVSPSVGKRGRGRPKKEKPAAARPAGTGDAKSMGIKRGRGRPRKDSSFQDVFAEQTVGEVSRDVTEARPEGDAELLSGKKTETAAVVSGESK